jgi:tRNA-specific 2-thiouridylase
VGGVFAEHLEHPVGRGHAPDGACTGAAGGAACGDLITIALTVQGDRVADAGFDAHGCGAAQAAGSAAVALVRGAPLLDAARVSAHTIAAELGGLSAGKFHAADLAADALHQALGGAARRHGALPADAERVLVAMSGGVDSAVAALLSGERAVAVTLELWRDPENDAEASCCSASAVRTARGLAHRMGLPHFTLDLRDEFRAGVVDPFVAAHAAGETPNPCVRCNGFVRLDAMAEFAQRLGAAALATGHYARIADDGLLRAAADPAKDQAYMLAALDPATLAQLRFPLGELEKPQVRRIAAEAGLPVADKRDSQDLCFLAGIGKARFLARELPEAPGPVLRDGAQVGSHTGVHHFTVGQRRGVGVAAEEPLYVLRTEPGRVHVGTRDQLRADRVALRDVRLLRPPGEVDAVKLRYRSRPLACRLVGDDVQLAMPTDQGAAPGQVAVLYRGDAVIGHGTIA